jgi:hypothetical protein
MQPIKDFAALLGDGEHCTKCHQNKIYILKSKANEKDGDNL